MKDLHGSVKSELCAKCFGLSFNINILFSEPKTGSQANTLLLLVNTLFSVYGVGPLNVSVLFCLKGKWHVFVMLILLFLFTVRHLQQLYKVDLYINWKVFIIYNLLSMLQFVQFTYTSLLLGTCKITRKITPVDLQKKQNQKQPIIKRQCQNSSEKQFDSALAKHSKAPSPSHRLWCPLLSSVKEPPRGWHVPLSTPGLLSLGKNAPSPLSRPPPSVGR